VNQGDCRIKLDDDGRRLPRRPQLQVAVGPALAAAGLAIKAYDRWMLQ
jgi:hypothetical protein